MNKHLKKSDLVNLRPSELRDLYDKAKRDRMPKRYMTTVEREIRRRKKAGDRPAKVKSKQGFCTDCGNESNHLVLQSAQNIGGVMVHLIRKGEQLCPCCASLRGHETLTEIHDNRREAHHG